MLNFLFNIGYTSMPANRHFHGHQQSEFATVAGGIYQGAPNMRNGPRGQFDQQQAEQAHNQPYYSGMHQQQLERDGARMPAPPNSQGGVQEVQKSNIPDKPVIRSESELSKFLFCTIECDTHL